MSPAGERLKQVLLAEIKNRESYRRATDPQSISSVQFVPRSAPARPQPFGAVLLVLAAGCRAECLQRSPTAAHDAQRAPTLPRWKRLADHGHSHREVARGSDALQQPAADARAARRRSAGF
jgi:hypothetical protein